MNDLEKRYADSISGKEWKSYLLFSEGIFLGIVVASKRAIEDTSVAELTIDTSFAYDSFILRFGVITNSINLRKVSVARIIATKVSTDMRQIEVIPNKKINPYALTPVTDTNIMKRLDEGHETVILPGSLYRFKHLDSKMALFGLIASHKYVYILTSPWASIHDDLNKSELLPIAQNNIDTLLNTVGLPYQTFYSEKYDLCASVHKANTTIPMPMCTDSSLIVRITIMKHTIMLLLLSNEKLTVSGDWVPSVLTLPPHGQKKALSILTAYMRVLDNIYEKGKTLPELNFNFRAVTTSTTNITASFLEIPWPTYTTTTVK